MPRTEFPLKVKKEALRRSDGRCELCGIRFALGGVQFDHRVSDACGGTATIENCACLCVKCHRAKTAKIDTPTAAKVKRQAAKHAGIRKPSKFQNARAGKYKTKVGGRTELR